LDVMKGGGSRRKALNHCRMDGLGVGKLFTAYRHSLHVHTASKCTPSKCRSKRLHRCKCRSRRENSDMYKIHTLLTRLLVKSGGDRDPKRAAHRAPARSPYAQAARRALIARLRGSRRRASPRPSRRTASRGTVYISGYGSGCASGDKRGEDSGAP
jgi:hypothetical protein